MSETVLPLIYSVTFLLLSGLFAVLHAAFRLSGEAGVPRFLEKYPSARRYAFWTERWPLLNASLLIAWWAMAVLAVEFMTPFGKQLPRGMDVLQFAGIVFLLILVLRLIPVAWAESYADRVTSATLPAVIALSLPLFPFATLVAMLEHWMNRVFLNHSDEGNRPSSEDEIISVVNHADADDLEETEREMIRSVLEFGETVTREIMTHRVNICAFDMTETVADCVLISQKEPYSRFPVYANSLDDVRGIVHVKDLLRGINDGKGQQPISSLCNNVTFVPETMPIDDLFHLLRSNREQLALVVDEYGGTAGLVSMEDIIEELVGEIHDEYDTADNKVQPMPDGSFLVDARMAVHEVNDTLKVNLPESEEYDSVGGLVFHLLGRIPGPGDLVHSEGAEIRIHTAVPNRIHTVRVIPPVNEE